MRSLALKGISIAAVVAGIVVTSGAVQPANAAFIAVTSRSAFDALGPFVPVDWSAFGSAPGSFSTPQSKSFGGLTVRASSSQGELGLHDETVADFHGTFAPGAHLLTDAGSESDSFIVGFDTPVKGFGTQVDAHYITGAYTGFVEVFADPNTLLFTETFSGNNTGAEDNSAPFVGVVSDTANIDFVKFWIDQPNLPGPSGALGINRLDVLVVPEPGTMALFAPLFFAVMGLGRRQRKLRRASAK